MQETNSRAPFLNYNISDFSETQGLTFQERNTGVLSSFVAEKNSNNEAHVAIDILLQALSVMDKEVQTLKDCFNNSDFSERRTLIAEFDRIEKFDGFLSYSIKTGGENFTFSFERNKSENVELIFKLESTIYFREQEREKLLEKYDKQVDEFLRVKYGKQSSTIIFSTLVLMCIVIPALYYFKL